MIQTVQKIIKIGSSKGVTIPTKQLATLQADLGDELVITAERASHAKHDKLMEEYNKFVGHYGQTLKNLADK